MQELETVSGQEVGFSREKVELVKQTVAKGATDLELQLFFHACKRTGLDPLMKQVYAIKRWNSQDQRETMTFQTGIDGYRLIADRTGCYAGSSDAEYEERLAGGPLVARVTVTKLVNGTPCQFTASARWDEYVQKNKQGQPTAMWQKMPYLMLAKCAESLALRKAFPAELSGVYTHEEMQQADEPLSPVDRYAKNKATTAAKFAELVAEGIHVEQDGAEHAGAIAHEAGCTQQDSDAAPLNESNLVLDLSVQINDAMDGLLINAILQEAAKLQVEGKLQRNDFLAIQKHADERRKQLKGK